jgi:hypothetical protein
MPTGSALKGADIARRVVKTAIQGAIVAVATWLIKGGAEAAPIPSASQDESKPSVIVNIAVKTLDLMLDD